MYGQTAKSTSSGPRPGGKDDHRDDEGDRHRPHRIALTAQDEVPEGVEEGRHERGDEGVERHRQAIVGSAPDGVTRALVFDFNGTISLDEPLLYSI